jgi:hypothetical protein
MPTKTQNTVLSDINEIYAGFLLAGKKWFDSAAKLQYEQRIKTALPEEVVDAQYKAEAMVAAFLGWASKNGYSNRVVKVWWTARPGSMSAAVGRPVDQKKNPTDILVKFSSGPCEGFLGLSAKATKTKGDIGFKNPGVGTIDKALKLDLQGQYDKELEAVIEKFNLPKTSKDRKEYIRSMPKLKEAMDAKGTELLNSMRDQMLSRLKQLPQKDLIKYLIRDWMNADIDFPAYIKVTGHGTKKPYSASVTDPTSNPKLSALSTDKVTLEKNGNDAIGVLAGTTRIMKMRFKFESQKMASSLKMSGDPW